MTKDDIDYLILPVNRASLQRLKDISKEGYPLIEKELSKCLNNQIDLVLYELALNQKVTILAGKR